MKNALILHGTGDDSRANWFEWLKLRLEKQNYKVWVPDLPDSQTPNLPKYRQYIFPKWQFNDESVLIGHSSGAVASLGFLEKLPAGVIVEKAILVAGFKDDLNWEALKELFQKPLDYDKIKTHCREFVVIASDDDPFVPVDQAKFLAEELNGKLVILPSQKHFSISTMGQKYSQFPEILEYI